MSNEIQKASDWETQIPLVMAMVAKNATKDEFSLMCHIARKYSLDPLVKQIWLVKYGEQAASIFTGRDGFLSIAHRTGQFNGIETVVEKVNEPITVIKTRSKWVNSVKETINVEVKRAWQYKAVCTVRRKDAEFPFTVEVYEEEYTTGENLWATKPRTMLGKVAESQCLRKAFDIAGLYSPEEMPDHEEREINPKTSMAEKQAEFERSKEITPQHGETPDIEPVPEVELTPEQIAKKENAEMRVKRLQFMTEHAPDVIEYFKAKRFANGKIFAIMDENNDDPELIRAYMRDNPIQAAKVENLAEHLKDEGIQ